MGPSRPMANNPILDAPNERRYYSGMNDALMTQSLARRRAVASWTMDHMTLVAMTLLALALFAFAYKATHPTLTPLQRCAVSECEVPFGTQLQMMAGNGYEVIWDPALQTYTLEPKYQANIFPCGVEDESRVTSVTPSGPRSFCLPTDDLSIGRFAPDGSLITEQSVDDYLADLGMGN